MSLISNGNVLVSVMTSLETMEPALHQMVDILLKFFVSFANAFNLVLEGETKHNSLQLIFCLFTKFLTHTLSKYRSKSHSPQTIFF